MINKKILGWFCVCICIFLLIIYISLEVFQFLSYPCSIVCLFYHCKYKYKYTNTQIPIKIQIQNPPTRNPFSSYALAALPRPCIVRCLHYLPTAQCDLMLWTSHPPRHTEPDPGPQLLFSPLACPLQPFFDALSRRV